MLGLGLWAAGAGAQPIAPDPDPELRAALSEAVAASDSFGDRFDAEVWLLDMSGRLQRFMPDDAERLEFCGWCTPNHAAPTCHLSWCCR